MVDSRILRPSYISEATMYFHQGRKKYLLQRWDDASAAVKAGPQGEVWIRIPEVKNQGQTASFQLDEPWGKLCFVFFGVCGLACCCHGQLESVAVGRWRWLNHGVVNPAVDVNISGGFRAWRAEGCWV